VRDRDSRRIAGSKPAISVRPGWQFADCPDPRGESQGADAILATGGGAAGDTSSLRRSENDPSDDPSGPAWESLHQGSVDAGRRAGRKGIPRPAAAAAEMAQDAVHDARLHNDGNDLHLGPARAQQRIDFENLP
jgi:hypothetical protein